MARRTIEKEKKDIRKKSVAVEEGFRPLWVEPAAVVDARLLTYREKFDQVFNYWQPDYKRLARNCRMYWGVDYSQYATEIAQRLLNEYRQPFQANIIAEKVETILSQTLQNPFDMTFKPIQISPNQEINDLSSLAISMYLEDKGQANWKFSQILAYLFALVQEGCEELVIDYKRQRGLPKLCFKPIDPLYYRRDPNWESMDPWDMREFWKFGNMTVEAMIARWPEKKAELETERLRQQNSRADYGQYKGAFPIEDVAARWGMGQTHRVLEYSYLVDEERWWEYDLRNNRPFPETGEKNQSEADKTKKRDYIARMQLNPGFRGPDGREEDGDITWIHQYRRVEKKSVFCPDLSLKVFFEDGDSPIQINRISKFPLGLAHFRQQYRGVVDALASPQEMLNRTEMNMADIAARGARDSFGIDKAAVDPEDRPYWIQNWNTPGFRGFFSEGYLQGGAKAFEPFPQGQINNDLFNLANHMIELADIVGKTPAAGHGRLEQKQTSGRLFTAQYQAGLVASGLWYYNIEQHERDKAEAWLMQGRQTYAGPEREVNRMGTQESFRINERVITDQGEIRIRNNISQLPDQAVIITPAPQGTTFQDAQRELYGYFMQNLAPDQAFLRTLFMGEIYKSMPNITDEKRQEIEKAINMQLEVLGIQMANTKLQLTGQNQMLKQQIGGMQQPGMGEEAPPLPGMAPPPAPAGAQPPLSGGPEIQQLLRSMGPAGGPQGG